MITPKLKPCPFCGGVAMVLRTPDSFLVIVCKEHGLSCGSPTCRTKTRAVISWNRRINKKGPDEPS